MFIDQRDLPSSLLTMAESAFSDTGDKTQEEAAFAFLSRLSPTQFPMLSTIHRLFGRELWVFECNGFFVSFVSLLPGRHHTLAINSPTLACITRGNGTLTVTGNRNLLWTSTIFHLPEGNHKLTTNDGCHIVFVSTCDKIINHE